MEVEVVVVVVELLFAKTMQLSAHLPFAPTDRTRTRRLHHQEHRVAQTWGSTK